jgi:phospholipid/cholesterol/gamma-HCH transport system substrate-binding protein
MDERVVQLRVGVVVLTAGIITGVLTFVFGAFPQFGRGEYTIYVQFPAAPGVGVDTPVRKSGIPIGRVSDVKLEDEGGVLLTLRIDDQYTLRLSEAPRITMASLVTGDSVLEFVPRSMESLIEEFDQDGDGQLDPGEWAMAQQPIQDGEYLDTGKVASGPLEVMVNLEGELTDAFASIRTAGDSVALAVGDLHHAFDRNQDRFERIMVKGEQALDNFNRTMSTINEAIGSNPQEETRLRLALDEMRAAFAEARLTLERGRETLDRFDRVADRAEENLANLRDVTAPLGEHADQMVGDLRSSLRNLDTVLVQLAQFSHSLNQEEGTIGRLIHDDEMYRRLDRVVNNVEELTVRVRPIMDDVRVFTDKIARDPRQLGVRGALDHRPTGTGFKCNIPNELGRR